MPNESARTIAEGYATGFLKELKLSGEIEQRCEWTCLLWSKDHWASQAQKAQLDLQQAKERVINSEKKNETVESLHMNSQFMNTVAQVYSRLFGGEAEYCDVKNFPNCPFMDQRQDLLMRGSLASTFVTILHKATMYAMLDSHPIDSGLVNEEYRDVYGINLTDFRDLENSLRDGRFEKLYRAVVKRARELANLPSARTDY